MGAVFALASAVSFGISDVSGAVAARRLSSVNVALGMQLAGLLALLPALWLLPGAPSWRAIAIGAAAGLIGNLGLILYLRCMALGPIGVISPIAALIGAAVPVAWGVLIAGDDLGWAQRVGVAVGLIAVVASAYRPGSSIRAGGSRGPLVALVAGAAFGLFFVILDATPPDSGLWPLLGARFGGLASILVMALAVRRSPIPRTALGLVAFSGITDVLANALFLLATRTGLLSLVSLLASLYPVVAVLVARLVLAERLSRLQGGGVVLAMVALALLVGG